MYNSSNAINLLVYFRKYTFKYEYLYYHCIHIDNTINVFYMSYMLYYHGCCENEIYDFSHIKIIPHNKIIFLYMFHVYDNQLQQKENKIPLNIYYVSLYCLIPHS